MRDRQRVRHPANRGRRRSDSDVFRRAGDAEAHVERARAGVEDECEVEKIALAEEAAAGLGSAEQRHDEQEGYCESYQHQECIAAGGGALLHLYDSCPCCHIRLLSSRQPASAPASASWRRVEPPPLLPAR